MKLLLISLLLGLTTASFIDVLEVSKNDILDDFYAGMEESVSLREFAHFGPEADEIESDIKTELGKSLRETLDHILQKIRESVDKGKQVKEELLDKAAEITEQLKNLGVDIGAKALDLLNKIKEKAKDWFQKLLEKIGIGKRGLGDVLSQLLLKLQVPAILEALKEKILQKVDLESLMAYIMKLFGKFSDIAQIILEPIRARGITGLHDLLEKVLDVAFRSKSNYYSVDYSLINLWQRVRDVFKGVGPEIRNKLMDLTNWLQTLLNSGAVRIQNSIEKLRQAAKEVIQDAKKLSQEACQHVIKIFSPFKEHLGETWQELQDAMKRVSSN